LLFNSFEFIFLFLPIALCGFAVASRVGPRTACIWLALCSIAFYAYWNPGFVVLLLGSVVLNASLGRAISRQETERRRNQLLAVGVALNLLLLFVFKYLQPLLEFLHQHAMISTFVDLNIILPLGLSFFTFTQIGYLVDRRDGLGGELDLARYAAFVTFFPHLIAGPVLHVRDIGPQLESRETLRMSRQLAASGAALFVMGLAKKVLLADPLAGFVETGFDDPVSLGMLYTWVVTLTYAAQLYFDFSGYSDMAVGLAAMFGIRFPLNFDSPFKSRSVIEYWQRWHITLSRYLNLLLYNPVALAISRWRVKRGLGIAPRDRRKLEGFTQIVVVPTLFTMILAGVWHGAGLQFLVFGLLHGAYLVVNHAWRIFRPGQASVRETGLAGALSNASKVLLTFVCVLVGFVFFRSGSVGEALEFLKTMGGMNGLGLPGGAIRILGQVNEGLIELVGSPGPAGTLEPLFALRLVLSYAIIWGAPNCTQMLGAFAPSLGKSLDPAARFLSWRPNLLWGLMLGLLFFSCVVQLRKTTVFLYFQF
jgi:D-alanyl-lipoteichoic acid acyltransferase DltB (MBOAT superfamily)